MDRTILVMFPLKAGKILLTALDNPSDGDPSLDVRAAFWLYRPEADDWRLYLASPVVDTAGPLEAYKRIQTALVRINQPDDDPWNELNLNNISVISPQHKLVRALRKIAGP